MNKMEKIEQDGKPYRKTVAKILNYIKPHVVLDIACGDGWTGKALTYDVTLHGIDYYSPPPFGYDKFITADINKGVPDNLGMHDAVVCCETMHYLQNPGLFLQSVRRHLQTQGMFIVTVPNPTYSGARLNYFLQGFPRSYSYFVQNAIPMSHMPWLSLGLFQLWLLLGLNGFKDIKVHDVEEKKPKNIYEIPLGWFAKKYYRRRLKGSNSENERHLWTQALSDQVIYGRHLVISAIAE